MSLKSRIEAALFVIGKAATVEEIAEILKEDPAEVEAELLDLIMDYSGRDGALEIDDENGYIIQVREEYKDIVEKLVPVELKPPVLKTLTIIALKEPIRQAVLKEMRGAVAYDHIPELVEKGLITRKKDKNGKSFILKTTSKFAEYFKLKGDTRALAKALNLIIAAFMLCIFAIGPVFAQPNYDRLYRDQPVLDYIYDVGEDPEEHEDNEEYIISPYALVRLPAKLRNKNIVLNPGYYLVKPEWRSGHRFTLFKQNGKIVGAVPVYEKGIVNPAETYPKPLKPKHSWYVKPFVFVKNVVIWPYEKLKERKLPPPTARAKVEFDLVGDGEYYDMWLYVEEGLYKMIFKLERPSNISH